VPWRRGVVMAAGKPERVPLAGSQGRVTNRVTMSGGSGEQQRTTPDTEPQAIRFPSRESGFDYRRPLHVAMPDPQVSSVTCWTLMISWPSCGVTLYQMVTLSDGRCSS
jgi:hypothetical protein